MKTLTVLLGAAVALSIPASARPSRDLGPLGNITWTAETVRIVLTRLDLGRSQRDKVYEVIGSARNEARDIERNRHLNLFERQERLADVSTELRGRVIHVLTGDQKDRLREILGGDRNRGPRYRPNGNRRDNNSGYDDRDYSPFGRAPNDRQDRNDWPWQ
ncbi:MAG TPA: hypothetical protein VGM51_16595 [Armatimonadota bacterium]|jgi:hypothetical protein